MWGSKDGLRKSWGLGYWSRKGRPNLSVTRLVTSRKWVIRAGIYGQREGGGWRWAWDGERLYFHSNIGCVIVSITAREWCGMHVIECGVGLYQVLIHGTLHASLGAHSLTVSVVLLPQKWWYVLYVSVLLLLTRKSAWIVRVRGSEKRFNIDITGFIYVYNKPALKKNTL